MDRVTFRCPHCGASVAAPPSLEGQDYPCPKCGGDVDRWPAPVQGPETARSAPAHVLQCWYYTNGTQRRGPVSETQLRALAESGIVRPTDLVWREGMPEWVTASRVLGLFPGQQAPVSLPAPTSERSGELEELPRRRRRRRVPFRRDRRAWIIAGSIGIPALALIGLVVVVTVTSLRGGRVDAGAGGRVDAGAGGRVDAGAGGGRVDTGEGGEVFYTSKVTRSEAERLGRYLVQTGQLDGDRKTIELTREGRTVQVRVVVKKGLDSDPYFLGLFRQFARELQRDVFPGERVDVHMCDEWLHTLRVIPAI